MSKCKITVLKKIFHRDLFEKYSSLSLSENIGGCSMFKTGDSFFVDNYNKMPVNFCPWAWADIHKDVIAALFGGDFPWMKQKGTNITCCTDGLMPVIFEVERIEE